MGCTESHVVAVVHVTRQGGPGCHCDGGEPRGAHCAHSCRGIGVNGVLITHVGVAGCGIGSGEEPAGERSCSRVVRCGAYANSERLTQGQSPTHIVCRGRVGAGGLGGEVVLAAVLRDRGTHHGPATVEQLDSDTVDSGLAGVLDTVPV